MPQATLINHAGLPAAPFRTDTLPCVNVEIQNQGTTRRVATATYEIVISPNGMPTSLLFHGMQFLSNEPGTAGGGSIPGFWGARTLDRIREIGPRLLMCSDDDVTLQMNFDEASLQWTINNHGKDPLTFQLALSPHVKLLEAVSEGTATLVRGTSRVSLNGFDSSTNTPTGTWLISLVKAGATKSISIR
jgi:hypothetical protein